MLYIIYQEDRPGGAPVRAANKQAHFAYLDLPQETSWCLAAPCLPMTAGVQ